jgi:hypothetical protein
MWIAVSVACWSLVCAAAEPTSAQAVLKRHVIGTLRAHKQVDISNTARGWVEARDGAALVEKSRVRTGSGGAGLLDFGRDGLIGLYPSSQLSLGQRRGAVLPIWLKSGELSFRLPPGGGLQLHTRSGVVRASGVVAVSSGGDAVEGFVRVGPDGETVVRVRSGIVGVKAAASPTFSPLSAGEETRFAAADTTLRVTRVTTDTGVPDAEGAAGSATEQAAPGKQAKGLAIFQENAQLAAVVGGVVLGGTGLALGLRYGVFDGDDDHEGSAFVPDDR